MTPEKLTTFFAATGWLDRPAGNVMRRIAEGRIAALRGMPAIVAGPGRRQDGPGPGLGVMLR